MRYSVEPRERRYVKGYGLGKNLSNEYGQKLIDSAKKSATDALKTTIKRAIQKPAEATGDLVGNEVADKITSYFRKSSDHSTELHSNDSNNEIPKE